MVQDRDYVSKKILAVRHIGTLDNVADFFTKALQGTEGYEKHRETLMGPGLQTGTERIFRIVSCYFCCIEDTHCEPSWNRMTISTKI